MANFKLMWENNADTPITASSLSKILDKHEYNNILFMDTEDFITNADDKLKIRPNSSIVTTTKNTSAFFSFNESLISHNSEYSASTASNINYRIESPTSGKTLALETETENKILNSNFSNGLDNWEITTTGTATITTTSGGLYGDYCAKFTIPTSSSAKLGQAIEFNAVASDDDNPDVSISFYYKSNQALNLLIIGKYDSVQPVYWNNSSSALKWEITSAASVISLEPTTTWQRVEIKNIRTDTLWSSSNENNNLKLTIYSSISGCEAYIDGVQIEEKEYCSSFTTGTRGESVLNYDVNLMRLSQGSLDLKFMPKYYNADKNILFRVKMNTQTNTSTSVSYTDAMRFELNPASYTASFYIYDVTTQTEKQISTTYSSTSFEALIDNWQRCIITWNQDTPIMKMSMNGDTPGSSAQTFTVVDSSELTSIEFGGYSSYKFEGLISSAKFNIFTKTSDEIIADSTEVPQPDDNTFKVFESLNESVIVDESYLDSGNEFEASTEYYIYLVDSESTEEELNIIVSTNPSYPLGALKFFSYLIGGFKTNSSSTPIISSLWDLKTRHMPTIMTQRFLVNGKSSDNNNVEIGTSPYSDSTDAVFNIPTYVTNHFYGTNSGTNFLDIDPSGFLKIDNVKIDGNIITSLNSNDLVLNSYTGKNIQITSTNVDIDAGDGDICLDNIRIKGLQIRPITGSNLTLSNDTANSEVIINGYSGVSRIAGSSHINDALSTLFDGQTVTISASITTQLNSGDNPVYIDNVSFDTNTISSKSGDDLILESDDIIQVNSPIRINNEQLRFNETNGQKIYLNDIDGISGFGIQNSSVYQRTYNHYLWFRQGAHSDTLGDAGTGGTVLALLTGNDQTASSLGVTFDTLSHFYAGRVHNAVWNDIAECWERDVDYKIEYNMVAVQTKRGIRPSQKRAEKASIGIVSNTYGYLLNDNGFDGDLNISNIAPIGIAGRVFVNMFGKAEIGDEVVSYKNGQVIRASLFEKIFMRDRILGKVDSILQGKYRIKI